MKQSELLKKGRILCYYLCACLFFFNKISLLKMVLHYAGIVNSGTGIAVGIFLLMDLCIGAYTLYAFLQRRAWALLGLLVLVCAAYGLPYAIHGEWYSLAQYCVFTLPFALCGGLLAAEEDGVERFLRCLEKISVGAVFFALGYILLLFLGTPDKTGMINIAEFSYGSVAYALVPFCFTEIELVLRGKQRWWIHGIRGMVYLCAIIYSGTRSAALCVACAAVMQILFHWKSVKEAGWKRALSAGAALAACLCLCFCVTPKGSRLNMIKNDPLYELQYEDSYTVINVATGRPATMGSTFDYYVSRNTCTREETVRILREDIVNHTGRYLQVPAEHQEKAENYIYHLSRVHLWNLAVMDIEKAPVFGNGILHYQMKIGKFPHNVVLELLADTGVVGCVLFFAFMGFAFVTLMIRAIKTRNQSLGTLLCLVVLYIPMYLLYTSLYSSGPLLFSMVAMLGLLLKSHAAAPQNKTIKNA